MEIITQYKCSNCGAIYSTQKALSFAKIGTLVWKGFSRKIMKLKRSSLRRLLLKEMMEHSSNINTTATQSVVSMVPTFMSVPTKNLN